MIPIPVQRLPESARDAYRDHLLALPPPDVYLRFGNALPPERIAGYADGINFDTNVVFGVHDEALQLLGAAHVAFADDGAELGLSVLPASRGRGIGSALFERSAQHVRNRFEYRLYMYCLAENAAMMRIARRAGMKVVVDAGDADAFLQLAPANPASITSETLANRMAVFDYALKAQSDMVRRMGRAFGGTDGASE